MVEEHTAMNVSVANIVKEAGDLVTWSPDPLPPPPSQGRVH